MAVQYMEGQECVYSSKGWLRLHTRVFACIRPEKASPSP